jgi:chromosome segregation ATPase
MAKTRSAQRENEKQTIEELTERYHVLNERKIQAQTNFKNAEKQLRDLQRKARDSYGTDNVEELKRQLEELKADNESKRATYEALLDKIETDLAEVEAKHGSVDDIADLL